MRKMDAVSSREAGPMKRQLILLLTCALASACGSTASAPAPSAPAVLQPLNGALSLGGSIVDASTGNPIAGAMLTLTGVNRLTTATTDTKGRFAVSGIPEAKIPYIVAAPGYLDHISSLVVSSSQVDVRLTAISVSGSFSLTDYRQFARGEFDNQFRSPLNPWTVAPSFYVRTVLEDTGEPVPAEIIDRIRAVFGNSIPELTGGHFQMGRFETGTDARPSATGTVNVSFVHAFPGTSWIGLASVGPSAAGFIKLRYDPAGFAAEGIDDHGCGSPTVSASDHEIVHAMGYFHTLHNDIDFHSGQGCPGTGRPQRVRDRAAAMYSRPPGNTDPDQDPVSFSSTTRTHRSAAPMVVYCPSSVIRR